MLRSLTLTSIVLFSLWICPIGSASEMTNVESNQVLFTSLSGMHLSEHSLRTLSISVQDEWTFYSMRASMKLSEEDYTKFTRKRTFFDWWSPKEPPYNVWKGTVLFDGPNDEFILDPSTVEYYIYAQNEADTVRRLYVLTSPVDGIHSLYFYYLSWQRRTLWLENKEK